MKPPLPPLPSPPSLRSLRSLGSLRAPSSTPPPSPFVHTSLASHKPFYAPCPPPPHTQRNCLPAVPTDIKGIDQNAYRLLNRKQVSRAAPKLCSNAFFNLRFYPSTHLVAIARKLNVAYTFTNSTSGYILNNPKLAEGFKHYNGKYKKLRFFQKIASPLSTAVKRTQFRRIVKRALFEAIHPHTNAVAALRGVYQFRLFIFPSTESDLERVRSDVRLAVNLLVLGAVRPPHAVATAAEKAAFRKTLRLYRAPGDHRVRGSYPKFPFLND